MKITSVVVPFLCTALLAACAAKQSGSDGADERSREAAELQHQGAFVTVPVASPLRKRLVIGAVEPKAFARTIEAPGVIEAAPEKLVRITPPLGGRIVAMHHQLGDAVKAGEPLVTLDSPDLGSAYNEQRKAQAALMQARNELTRQKALLEEDISAKKDFEAAQLALAQAEDDARATTDRLAQFGVTSQAASRREYTLRSPISGRVVDMRGSLGGYWNDNTTPIMTVADLSTVWLTANVSEKDLSQLFVGQPARIILNAYPDREFDRKVNYIGDLLDPDTRTVPVRVALDNRQGLLKPGMFARASFSGASHRALLIPSTALLQSGLYTRVFVEQAPFRYVSHIVNVGVSTGDHVEVTSGLKAGERIVIRGGVLLND